MKKNSSSGKDKFKKGIQDEVLAAGAAAWNEVKSARYANGLRICRRVYKKYPDEPLAQYYYAVLLGDHEEGLTSAVRERNRREAAKLLRQVVTRIRSIPEKRRTTLLNEYYWFSRQPLKQFRHGQKQIGSGKLAGTYSMGVGAASYAKQLIKKGQIMRGLKWAEKSKMAWEEHFKYRKNYYNTYCWYARALGILGDARQMERALQKAAKLSKRPLHYFEFEEVRVEVSKLRKLIVREG